MTALGPYTFTATDAAQTLARLGEALDHAAHGRPAGLFDGLRAQAAGVTDLAGAWAILEAIRPTLAAAGLLPLRAEGRLDGLFVSAGGLPKHPLRVGAIGFSGLGGDRQATRKHHGRPQQALCLWSAEVVEALAAAGHPIAPGFAGENLSLRGLDPATLQPGVRLGVGEMRCELLGYAIPCSQNARWMADGDIGRLHHRRGWSRLYARVLAPGAVAVGDPVVLEPG